MSSIVSRLLSDWLGKLGELFNAYLDRYLCRQYDTAVEVTHTLGTLSFSVGKSSWRSLHKR